MQPWFRFWAVFTRAVFALTIISAISLAASAQTPPGARKHKAGASLLESLEGQIDEQAKQIEQLTKQVDLQNKQLELQTKQVELQSKQLETLTGQVSHVAQLLEATATRASSPATPVEPAPPAPSSSEPAQSATAAPPAAAPAVETSSTPAATTAIPGAAEPEGATHVVKKGENLTSIARHANTTVFELLKLNKIEDERKLQIGQVLILPKPGSTSTTSQPNKDSQ